MENNFIIKQPFVPDVSSWEDKQDWSQISPKPFAAIARATYSNWLLDNSLAHNWAQWREHGIRKTAYGFPQPMYGADDQAKFFVKTVKAVGGWDEGDLPPVLDFETAGFTAHQIKVYLDRVEGEFGMKPIIYTRRDIWDTICTKRFGVFVSAPSWTQDYHCWVGWYPWAAYIDANDTVPANRMPRGWDRWSLWQYSEAGRLSFDAVNGYDFNVMSDWYKAEIENTPTPEPNPEPEPPTDPPVEPPVIEPPIDEPDLVTGKLLEGMNLRTSAVVSDTNQIGFLFKHEKVSGRLVSEGNNKWLEMDGGSFGNLYVAEYHGGKRYIQLNDTTTPVTGRVDWKPDPNRPAELYWARHEVYYEVPVYETRALKVVKFIAPHSAIFLGDKIVNNHMHVIRMNDPLDKTKEGWIDLGAPDMTDSRIPENVLNSLIPPKTKEPVLKRFVKAPDSGQYLHIPHMVTKPYNVPVPDTIVLWEDKPHQPGWVTLTPPWQWFCLDLMKVAAPGQSIIYYVMAYAYHYRDNGYWTDNEEKDRHRDVITGQNPNATDYKVKWSITTRGNIVKVENKISNSTAVLGGLDITKPPPLAEDVIDNPALVHGGTQQYPKILENKRPKVTNIPSVKLEVNGVIEKTFAPFPKFAAPHEVDIRGMVVATNGIDYPLINLERDQA